MTANIVFANVLIYRINGNTLRLASKRANDREYREDQKRVLHGTAERYNILFRARQIGLFTRVAAIGIAAMIGVALSQEAKEYDQVCSDFIRRGGKRALNAAIAKGFSGCKGGPCSYVLPPFHNGRRILSLVPHGGTSNVATGR